MNLWVVFNETANTHVLSTSQPSNVSSLVVVEVNVPAGLPAKAAFETAISAITSITNQGPVAALLAVKLTFA
jgi:hypothetical protein